jgi:hypothetical protein
MVPQAGHQRFRLKIQLLGVSENRTIVEIPSGSEVVLLDSVEVSTLMEHTKRVSVKWRDQKLMLFAIDLFEKAERL